MIAGIGVDIVKIKRFETAGERFMERCFTAREREYLRGKPANSVAGMFAAKEAVVKAIGTGFRDFWPDDVEILHNELGAPAVNLRGLAKETAVEMKIEKIWVSISHSDTDAVAFAMAERTDTL